jgi:hypothetical protein
MDYWPKCFHYRHEIWKIIFLDRSIRSGTQYMQAILVSQLKSPHTCSICQDSQTETCYQEKNVGFKDKLLMNSIEESRQAISFHWFAAHRRKKEFLKEEKRLTYGKSYMSTTCSEDLHQMDYCHQTHVQMTRPGDWSSSNTLITSPWLPCESQKFESQKSLEKGYSSERLRVLNLHELKRDPSLNIQNWSDNWRVKSGMRKQKLNKINRNHQVR